MCECVCVYACMCFAIFPRQTKPSPPPGLAPPVEAAEPIITCREGEGGVRGKTGVGWVH